jgi:anti-anti-sigma factor
MDSDADPPPVEFVHTEEGGTAVLVAKGRLDFQSAPALAEALLAVAFVEPLVLDLSGAEAIDARALEVLVDDDRRRDGGLFIVCAPDSVVSEAFSSAAATRALARYPDRASAVAAATATA